MKVKRREDRNERQGSAWASRTHRNMKRKANDKIGQGLKMKDSLGRGQ